MKAEAAKKLTKRVIEMRNGVKIEEWLDGIYQEIERAAADGRWRTLLPFKSLKILGTLAEHQKQEIREILVKDGYTIWNINSGEEIGWEDGEDL